MRHHHVPVLFRVLAMTAFGCLVGAGATGCASDPGGADSCGHPGYTFKSYCSSSADCGPVLTCMKPCPSCDKTCNLPCGGGGGDALCAGYGAGTCRPAQCSSCFAVCSSAPTSCGTGGGTNPADTYTGYVDTRPSCVPKCSGHECGDDGCGGTCGDCNDDEACSATGRCERVCECDWGDTACASGPRLKECDGCDYTTYDCDPLCKNAGYSYSTGCSYYPSDGRYMCDCKTAYGNGWGQGCWPDFSACGYQSTTCITVGSNKFCSKPCSTAADCGDVGPGAEYCLEIASGNKYCFLSCDGPSDCKPYTSCVDGLCL